MYRAQVERQRCLPLSVPLLVVVCREQRLLRYRQVSVLLLALVLLVRRLQSALPVLVLAEQRLLFFVAVVDRCLESELQLLDHE